MLQRVADLYDRYVQQVADLETHRKIGEGLFGAKDGPKNHPCHEQFSSELSVLLEELEKAAPGSAAVKEVLHFIYAAPKKYPEPVTAYWMLIAVHGLTAKLIGQLGKEDAESLLTEYCRNYKRWERLPVQNQTIRLLKEWGGRK